MLKVSRKLWPVNSMVRPGKVSVMARPSTCPTDRKSTRLNSSHQIISYAVFCLKKKKRQWSGKLLLDLFRGGCGVACVVCSWELLWRGTCQEGGGRYVGLMGTATSGSRRVTTT